MKSKLIRTILIILIGIVFVFSFLLTLNNLTKPSTEMKQEINFQISAEPKININEATAEQLNALPGIGNTLAQRIIKYRETKPFESVEELDNVKGIGSKTVESLKKEVCVK